MAVRQLVCRFPSEIGGNFLLAVSVKNAGNCVLFKLRCSTGSAIFALSAIAVFAS